MMTDSGMFCFDKPTFSMYLFVLFCIFAYLIYYIKVECFSDTDLYSSLDVNSLLKKISELQDSLFNSKLNEQKCQSALQQYQGETVNTSLNIPKIQTKFLNKIYNPLSPPENTYPGGSFYSQGYNGYQNYQMLGYITSANGQFPIYGRYKDPGRTDRLEYYTINESRNSIKIPVSTKNYNELYDGDSITVPELNGTFTFKKYENEGLRYNPNI
jgi:hypothetical protein